MVTCTIGYGNLNEIKELGLDEMEHDNMPIKGQKRSPGNFRKLKVVIES